MTIDQSGNYFNNDKVNEMKVELLFKNEVINEIIFKPNRNGNCVVTSRIIKIN